MTAKSASEILGQNYDSHHPPPQVRRGSQQHWGRVSTHMNILTIADLEILESDGAHHNGVSRGVDPLDSAGPTGVDSS